MNFSMLNNTLFSNLGINNKNKIIGKITLKQLLSGIQRPRQENKKYA